MALIVFETSRDTGKARIARSCLLIPSGFCSAADDFSSSFLP